MDELPTGRAGLPLVEYRLMAMRNWSFGRGARPTSIKAVEPRVTREARMEVACCVEGVGSVTSPSTRQNHAAASKGKNMGYAQARTTF